jgi:hypothetical protein
MESISRRDMLAACCRRSLDGCQRRRRANRRGYFTTPASRSRRHRSWTTQPDARWTEPGRARTARHRSRFAAELTLLSLCGLRRAAGPVR